MTNTEIVLDATTERRAQALAEVAKMQQDLNLCQEEIRTLRREKERCEDRIDMLVEERNRYRTESSVLKKKLIELARTQANIGLLTRQAEEVMMTIDDLAANETPEQAAAEKESASAAVAALPPNKL